MQINKFRIYGRDYCDPGPDPAIMEVVRQKKLKNHRDSGGSSRFKI